MPAPRGCLHASKWRLNLLAVVSAVVMAQGVRADDVEPLVAPARQLFEQHCQECHGGTKHKGDFQIESLSGDFADKANRERWFAVFEQLKSGEMPPDEEPRPAAEEIQAVVDWISERAEKAERAQRAAEGRVVLRRLNRAEYANTVRDLLGVEVDLTDLLPPDISTSGFDNNAAALHTSSYLLRSYLDAAERVLDEAIANRERPYQIKKPCNLLAASIAISMTVWPSSHRGSRRTSGLPCGIFAATCAASIDFAFLATAIRVIPSR